MSQFISKEDRTRIDDLTLDTAQVAKRYGAISFRTGRNKIIGDCPCGNKDALEIVTSGTKKHIFKCFHCDIGGKGGSAYLQKVHGMDWNTAYAWLAKEFGIEIQGHPSAQSDSIAHKGPKVTFRDLQLRHSGIPLQEQIISIKVDANKAVEQHRYTSGTMLDGGEYTANGNDMVLWYVGLDGNYIMVKGKNGGKLRPLIRVRYQYPDVHVDRDGRPIKYRSPAGSGSHLWLPNRIIAAHAKAQPIKTLYVVEGEKKADKMTLHGLPAVGIMGIHNLATGNEMPRAFEALLTRCAVEEVVFVLDSDWQDISATPGKPIDQRPRTFLRAIQKFREYFYAYRNSGIDLRIFMVAGTNPKLKGFDDLLASLQEAGKETLNQPGALAADIERAMLDQNGQGEYVFARNIHPLRVPEQKLMELFRLDDAQRFFEAHFERLREMGEFVFGKLLYFFNSDTGQIELANQILESERFYSIVTEYTRSGERKVCNFNYDTIRNFLYNRGIGLYEFQSGNYRMIRKDKSFYHDVTHAWIQRYVVEFAETIKDKEERSLVVQMLLKGNTQYLGPNNLNYMRLHNPEWINHSAEEQFMVFRNCFWRITPDTIEQRPLSELPGSIWSNQVIGFDAEYLGAPMVKVSRQENKWKVTETPAAQKSELFQYVKCTSLFGWQKLYELARDPQDGVEKYVPKEGESLTREELDTWYMHIATKLIAWGYKLRIKRDQANMRAVICMDGLESAVGKSQGGSGKSIYALATQYCQPTFCVDGKTADLKSDKFVYHGVDERTREIVIDDVGVNFPFELLFSQITNFIRVKPFQGAPITLPAPVFTITTNHSINGEGNSFKRRQYQLGFSNFFNEKRTPAHHFGHLLFDDWSPEQWNLYYNLMATCLQVYMNFSDLGRYQIESDDINRRRLRQQIGEDFLDFADGYFVPGYMLNRIIVKERVLEDYLALYPGHRKFMDARRIKEKCRLFSEYKQLDYNPGAAPDGRLKSSGFEFILVADNQYDANNPMNEKVYKDTIVSRVEL